MTNQESIECTCRVGTVVTDGRVDGDEVIKFGPCHAISQRRYDEVVQERDHYRALYGSATTGSPGPEVWEALEGVTRVAEKWAFNTPWPDDDPDWADGGNAKIATARALLATRVA